MTKALYPPQIFSVEGIFMSERNDKLNLTVRITDDNVADALYGMNNMEGGLKDDRS
jgi:hypothetical protein